MTKELKYITQFGMEGDHIQLAKDALVRADSNAKVTYLDEVVGKVIDVEQDDLGLLVTMELSDEAYDKIMSAPGPSAFSIPGNAEIYKREMELAGSIRKSNRHSTATGEWFGPSPEPRPAGPECTCTGCIAVRWAWEQANPATDALKNS